LPTKRKNKRGEIEELMKDFPVWISDVKILEDALNMIESVGEITGRQSEAKIFPQPFLMNLITFNV
jgi:hypothetical protein